MKIKCEIKTDSVLMFQLVYGNACQRFYIKMPFFSLPAKRKNNEDDSL